MRAVLWSARKSVEHDGAGDRSKKGKLKGRQSLHLTSNFHPFGRLCTAADVLSRQASRSNTTNSRRRNLTDEQMLNNELMVLFIHLSSLNESKQWQTIPESLMVYSTTQKCGHTYPFKGFSYFLKTIFYIIENSNSEDIKTMFNEPRPLLRRRSEKDRRTKTQRGKCP